MSAYWIFVGTYGSAEQESIHIFSMDRETGSVSRLSSISGIDSPSYLAIDEKRSLLFAASEADAGGVASYRFDPQSGRLEELSKQKRIGDYPCHVHLDATGKWLLAANYGGGSVSVFPIDEQGVLGEMSDHIQHEGSSVLQDRQAAPHPHSIFPMPNSPFWVVPDLGCDSLFVYKLNPSSGKLHRQSIVRTSAGAGPRHVAFHPHQSWMYVIEELSSTIAVYEYSREDGSLREIQRIGTLPEGYGQPSIGADIHIDAAGEYVYGSNRGHDSVALFRIQNDGILVTGDIVSTEGAVPRSFVLTPDDRFLFAAHQDSDSVTIFQINNGVPVYTGNQLDIYKPVCVKVLAGK